MTPSRLALQALVLAVAGAAGTAARAESNPYYLGVSETLTQDSNLYRLAGDAALPASVSSRSDTVMTTSLVAGIDRSLGRQHLNGSASLRNNRYLKNDNLNYNGYGLNLVLDWETADRLSGTISLNTDRSLRRFDAADQAGGVTSIQNIETDRTLAAKVRLGVVTRMTLEAGLTLSSVGFSADAYRAYGSRNNTLSTGVRYRLGGATTVSAGLRRGRVNFSGNGDGYDRNDLDLSVAWAPSGLTTVNARISASRTAFDRSTQYDFSGITWELRGSTQVTGKVGVSATLWHDLGLSNSTFTQFVNLGGTDVPFGGVAQFNRASTALRVGANYQATAKISGTGSLTVTKRDLSTSLVTQIGPVPGGGDTTTTLAFGARWQPTRAWSLGCDLSNERRSATGTVSSSYGATTLGCFGQFVIQ